MTENFTGPFKLYCAGMKLEFANKLYLAFNNQIIKK
jgi:hypothetical protein